MKFVTRYSNGGRTLLRRHTGAVPTTLEPVEVVDPELDDAPTTQYPWIVLVWNDPVNLMSYVTFVFQKLFGYSLEEATDLMLDVHEKGRAVVASCGREEAEMHVFRLHEHSLWATMEQDK
jgi:ATP-dependent Clp protease adaptor protein ClpS